MASFLLTYQVIQVFKCSDEDVTLIKKENGGAERAI